MYLISKHTFAVLPGQSLTKNLFRWQKSGLEEPKDLTMGQGYEFLLFSRFVSACYHMIKFNIFTLFYFTAAVYESLPFLNWDQSRWRQYSLMNLRFEDKHSKRIATCRCMTTVENTWMFIRQWYQLISMQTAFNFSVHHREGIMSWKVPVNFHWNVLQW